MGHRVYDSGAPSTHEDANKHNKRYYSSHTNERALTRTTREDMGNNQQHGGKSQPYLLLMVPSSAVNWHSQYLQGEGGEKTDVDGESGIAGEEDEGGSSSSSQEPRGEESGWLE